MNKKIVGAAGLLTAGLVAGSFMTIAGANAASTPSANPTAPTFAAHAPEEAVTGTLATTLSDLAKAKVPGATVVRVEKDSDGVATYEVHMDKADGTHVVVNFDANNAIISVVDAPARGPKGDRTPPTEVTGAIATTLSDLAKAKVADATVDHVFADTRNGAAYVVLMKKTDGTRVAVHFDSTNKILSVDTPPAGGPKGDRTPPVEVTGAIATTLSDLAKAKVADATVEHVFADTRNGAAYVVLMKKADGTRVAVHFDSTNKILSVDTPPAHGPEGKGKGHGPRGGHGDNQGGNGGDSSWTPPTTTTP